MARAHIHIISAICTLWFTESIMLRGSSPSTLRCLVQARRDAGTFFQHIFPLSLTNPIASTLSAHFTHQDDTLLASLRDKATHITDRPTHLQPSIMRLLTLSNTQVPPSPPHPPLTGQHYHMATIPTPSLHLLHPPQIMQIHMYTRRGLRLTLCPHTFSILSTH
jgi:hypothetical protein